MKPRRLALGSVLCKMAITISLSDYYQPKPIELYHYFGKTKRYTQIL
ncbi:MAG: hypothetical protein HRT67_13945 [Flavobacteriaceae bacterium]|nr:hypothetical protein [Flavobacteriaceae bacterium]